MNRKEILSSVHEVFVDTLDNDEVRINESTKATDVDEWDSLTHIMLVVAIEKKFNIRFNSSEIQSWNNVGEMIDCIQEKGI
jgi:acyl carrier protein|tara:strand:+ start:626 stop:868 length:243 start_codon:yes stop_codon:yes gene_type:complete